MSINSKQTFVYAGPTAAGTDLLAFRIDGLVVKPPVRRGDIAALVREHAAPGRIVIIDGTYFSFPAVGHIELREAIDAGWEVWGLCSMGAIRAYEMRHMGMRGFGRVFQCFFEHDDFQDDEVALLHGEDAPYLALSEPLLHLRGALSALVADGRVTRAAAAAIVSQLKAMWFGSRTLPRVRAMLAAADGGVSLTAQAFEALVDVHRIKKQDLLSFFMTEPWRGAGVVPG